MKITNISLSGLWGVKDYSLKLHDDFNFIIGPNGSGKTTLLTLISSIVSMDIETINKIDFFQCEIDMICDDECSYKLSVFKGEGFVGEDIINFVVEMNGEEISSDIIKCGRVDKNDADSLRFRRTSRKYNVSDELKSFLENKISMTWLPIGRGAFASTERDGRVNSSVDVRLDSVSDRIVKYMSYINQTVSDRMNDFQKDIFMSSIDFSFVDIIKKSNLSIASSMTKDTLIEAFKEVGIEERLYQKKVNKMFSVMKNVENKHSSKDKDKHQLSFDEILWMFNAWKSTFLVEKFNEYKELKNAIKRDVDSFIEVLNSLFEGRKRFFISKLNELCSYSNEGYEIKLSDLSSGEKQLIIILGEALLQHGSNCIYMADEPELSLHVSWQEKIVDSIVKINKNAQIIFATHSPDIVSWRTGAVIFMDEI